nr:hypothetical protein BdHM001_35880 [Bdellovibrio sp. HM001]
MKNQIVEMIELKNSLNAAKMSMRKRMVLKGHVPEGLVELAENMCRLIDSAEKSLEMNIMMQKELDQISQRNKDARDSIAKKFTKIRDLLSVAANEARFIKNRGSNIHDVESAIHIMKLAKELENSLSIEAVDMEVSNRTGA